MLLLIYQAFVIIGVMQRTALLDEFLPCGFAVCSGEIHRLEVHFLKHVDEKIRHINMEGRTGCGTHNGKSLSAFGGKYVFLLLFIDTAGLLIQAAKIVHIIRRQSEYEAVLAGVDDCGGFPRDFLASHKVLDILGDNDLHTVILTDTLCQLEHEVQSNRELGIDEYMSLVDNNHNLSFQVISQVVIPVLDDLIIDIFQHQQHLCVGYG